MLKDYYLKNLSRDKADIAHRLEAKKNDFQLVFNDLEFVTQDSFEVAIYGCAIPEHVYGHKKILNEIFSTDIQIDTYDIDIAHLDGCDNVYEFDCVNMLPKKYNVIIVNRLGKQ